MKFLIPTDFSPLANYGIQFGIQMIKQTKGEIHLLHALDSNSNIEMQTDEFKELQRTVASKALNKLERSVITEGLNCKSHLIQGSLLNALKKQTTHESYDAIVMGSHGRSGKEEWFLGSNTTKALRKVHENIIIVKTPVNKIDFRKVVFVSGLEVREQQSFKLFLAFIEQFNVEEIHLLSIDTGNYFTQPTVVMEAALQDFKRQGNNSKVKTHFYSDFSIQSGIAHFVSENNIGLIGISNYVHKPLKRLFRGSNVEMLVHNSDLPILAVDHKQ